MSSGFLLNPDVQSVTRCLAWILLAWVIGFSNFVPGDGTSDLQSVARRLQKDTGSSRFFSDLHLIFNRRWRLSLFHSLKWPMSSHNKPRDSTAGAFNIFVTKAYFLAIFLPIDYTGIHITLYRKSPFALNFSEVIFSSALVSSKVWTTTTELFRFFGSAPSGFTSSHYILLTII